VQLRWLRMLLLWWVLIQIKLTQRMYHLGCNYQLTPYRKFGKMMAEPHKSAV